MKKRLTTPDERRLFEALIAASRPLPGKPAKPRAAAPQARLDLHGLTEAAAHRALLAFVRAAHKRGLRSVLVITGKGEANDLHAPYEMALDRRPRGVLKSAVPRWLNEKEFSALIRGAEPAPRRQGGDGALLVRLRK